MSDCCNDCSSDCTDCGGNCGTAKEYITKQGIQGEDGYGYDATSVTSSNILDTVSTSGTFTITTKKAYSFGARVRFTDASNSSNYFEGLVAAYSSVTGVMTVGAIDLKEGSGTIASWNVNVAGEIGAPGTSILYANTTPEAMIVPGAYVDDEFSTFSYSLPAGTLSKDGDCLRIKSLFLRDASFGLVDWSMFFNGVKVTYIPSAITLGEQTVIGDIVITRVSNTEVSFIGETRMLESDAVVAFPNTAINTTAGLLSAYNGLRRSNITGLNLTTTAYSIVPKVTADAAVVAVGASGMYSMIIEKMKKV